jgi:A/G-specific adenine glycosylase
VTQGKWTAAGRKRFRARLRDWFVAHARDLPWRRTHDPYSIWVSEIMLQQTRVAAVLEHYTEFLRRFPTVSALAKATEADVLAAWSGLGYYRRARMLYRGAQAVVNDHGEVVPGTAAVLLTLPGIGAYTSAAIASIGFGEAVAAVDGNVERVITRLDGLAAGGARNDTARQIRVIADLLLDPDSPGDFNQAMMELGATVCLPRNPLCLECPVASQCQTRGEHPVERRKPMVRREVAIALVLQSIPPGGTHVLLQKRPTEGTVMPGMWELPEITTDELDRQAAEVTVRHAIMQTNYAVRVYAMDSAALSQHGLSKREERWVVVEALGGLPLTGLARKVLRRVGLMAAGSAQS